MDGTEVDVSVPKLLLVDVFDSSEVVVNELN